MKTIASSALFTFSRDFCRARSPNENGHFFMPRLFFMTRIIYYRALFFFSSIDLPRKASNRERRRRHRTSWNFPPLLIPRAARLPIHHPPILSLLLRKDRVRPPYPFFLPFPPPRQPPSLSICPPFLSPERPRQRIPPKPHWPCLFLSPPLSSQQYRVPAKEHFLESGVFSLTLRFLRNLRLLF